MHTPVLLDKVIKALDIKKGGKYIDATFGEGGHTREILKKGGRVLGIEWDEEQYKKAKIKYKKHKPKIKNLTLVWGNFADIETIAKKNDFYPTDGVLFDLGLSMSQIKESGRGFSYKKRDEPLDMRISKSLRKTAAYIVNSFKEDELYQVFAGKAEEVNSWPIAEGIVRARKIKTIATVGDLVKIIEKTVGKKDLEATERRIFQALRIEINREFENLKKGLAGAANIILKSGKVVVITFHSLEDRLVKKFVQGRKYRFLTKKPITGKGEHEFERSAKLRIIVKN